MAPSKNPLERTGEIKNHVARMEGMIIGKSMFGDSKAPLPRLNARLAREIASSMPMQPETDSRLSAIETDFPHIAEKLTLVWGYPNCFSYLSELIIDNRGNRKGFNLDIMNDLMLLLKMTEQVTPDQWARPPGKNR